MFGDSAPGADDFLGHVQVDGRRLALPPFFECRLPRRVNKGYVFYLRRAPGPAFCAERSKPNSGNDHFGARFFRAHGPAAEDQVGDGHVCARAFKSGHVGEYGQAEFRTQPSGDHAPAPRRADQQQGRALALQQPGDGGDIVFYQPVLRGVTQPQHAVRGDLRGPITRAEGQGGYLRPVHQGLRPGGELG